MKILPLTLNKKWFDLILSGDKKEEYREVKPYWTKRLVGKEFDIIRFKNGYAIGCPEMDVEFKGCKIGLIGGENNDSKVEYYIINLGKVISTVNV